MVGGRSHYNGAIVATGSGTLTIASGGILQTPVTGGESTIAGGKLTSGTGEFVVSVNSATQRLTISSTISGSNVLTKTGAGTLRLSGINHSSGATLLLNGTLQLSGGNALGDRSSITFSDDHYAVLQLLDDETIGNLGGGTSTAGLENLATVDIGAKRLTVNQTGATTFSGLLTGAGALIKSGAATLTLGGASTGFTGDVIVNQGQLTLSSRTIANLTSVGSVTLNAGTLVLDFAGGTEAAPNKINNSAPITLINTGGIDGLRANNDRVDATKAEVLGAVTFLGGANTITASQSATGATADRQMTITAASLTRSNQSTVLIRGQNLGTLTAGTTGAFIASGRMVSTAVPTLTGAGGAAGTTFTSILPWAIGSNSITGNGESFVTHGANGFRPLNLTTEYEQLIPGGGTTYTNNVRYSSGANLTLAGTAKSMNSFLVDNTSGSAGIIVNGNNASLNVTSGAFLFTNDIHTRLVY